MRAAFYLIQILKLFRDSLMLIWLWNYFNAFINSESLNHIHLIMLHNSFLPASCFHRAWGSRCTQSTATTTQQPSRCCSSSTSSPSTVTSLRRADFFKRWSTSHSTASSWPRSRRSANTHSSLLSWPSTQRCAAFLFALCLYPWFPVSWTACILNSIVWCHLLLFFFFFFGLGWKDTKWYSTYWSLDIYVSVFTSSQILQVWILLQWVYMMSLVTPRSTCDKWTDTHRISLKQYVLAISILTLHKRKWWRFRSTSEMWASQVGWGKL